MIRQSNKPIVLIVDDNDLVRSKLVDELLAFGFQVTTAASSKDSLDQVRRKRIDVVLLNVAMCDFDGLATFKKIHILRPHLPVVIHTESSSMKIVREALRHGARDFLLKPSQTIDVTYRIEKVLLEEKTRRLADTAEQYHKKLGSLQTLASGFARDLNNHLIVILSNTQQVLEELVPGQGWHAELSDVLTSAEEIVDLGGKLLSDAESDHVEMTPIDLGSIASSLVQSVCDDLGDHVMDNVNIQVDTEHQLTPVMVDLKELRTVIKHLLVNAIEASGDQNANIRVYVCRRIIDQAMQKHHPGLAGIEGGDFACIRVTDEGAGMDIDTLNNMFDPFFSTKTVGRGLGLPSVLGTLSGHGGGVCVQSEPGKGTTVEALIPVASSDLHTETDAIPHTVVKPPPPTQTTSTKQGDTRALGRIMIIDDETLVRRCTEKALKRAGCTVDSFSNGPDGIDRFRESPKDFDLVILDLCMPDVDGHDVLRDIRKIDPAATVLLTSGYHSSEVANHFQDERPDGFIPKPYPIDELLDKVTSLI